MQQSDKGKQSVCDSFFILWKTAGLSFHLNAARTLSKERHTKCVHKRAHVPPNTGTFKRLMTVPFIRRGRILFSVL